MLFLLAAFTANPRELTGRFRSLANPKAAFFLFWIVFFVVSHLWNFRTAPWNGDGLFDESGWDLWYLKSYVIGHPYQAAWFHPPISRETLFHYYVWGFLSCSALTSCRMKRRCFVIWLTTFIFTLLLVDLFFRSYIVTSVTALVFNFLPFAFIYTFAGYRYPMAVALAVVSLYFLHVGFRNGSLILSLAGRHRCGPLPGQLHIRKAISAGPSDCCPAVRAMLLETLKARGHMDLAGFSRLWLSSGCRPDPPVYSNQSERLHLLRVQFCSRFLACNAVSPVSDWNQALYQPTPELLFQCPGPPVLYPGYAAYTSTVLLVVSSRSWYSQSGRSVSKLCSWRRFRSAAHLSQERIENRLLLPIPFWMILMSFTVAWILKLRPWPGVQVVARRRGGANTARRAGPIHSIYLQ